MILIYDFILLIYAFFYLPYLLLTNRGYAGFGIRFGFFTPQLREQIKVKDNIWLHAVSVGEVMVLDGFINQLRSRYPNCQMVVSVTTKTGYQLACERLKDKALVIPSPIDFSFVVKRFVALINPKIYIAVETEIWPNLYRQISFNKITMMVINGRISDASFGRYKAIRFLLKRTLNQVQVWCMQSQKDADRIKLLGAEPSRVVVTGNVKFDEFSVSTEHSKFDFVNNEGNLWWVAGSTHPGEEEIVLDVYSKIVKDNSNWRLIIAPRHIERASQIKELINRRGIKDVIVIDTIGQLRSLYSIASLVFVGKSLCVGGGHNVIEPAFYGKAIIIGPRVENFRDIVACFKEANAIIQVENIIEFELAVKDLCADTSKREVLGIAAKKVIAANQGASKRSLDHLADLLK